MLCYTEIFRDFAARLESVQHWSKDNSDDNEGEKAEDEEKDDESSASGSSGESPQQNLRVSPRVVRAPRDNYIDSLGKEQWQRKKKEGPVGSGGVRKRGDSAYVSSTFILTFWFCSCNHRTSRHIMLSFFFWFLLSFFKTRRYVYGITQGNGKLVHSRPKN